MAENPFASIAIRDAEDIDSILTEGQNRSVIFDAYPKIRSMMWENERIVKMWNQQGVLFPATITFTTERCIWHKRNWMGGAYIQDELWRNLGEPGHNEYKEGPLFVTFSIPHRDEPRSFVTPFMPKVQARRMWGYVFDMAMYWHDEGRMRVHERNRAKSGGVIFKGALASMNTYAVPNPIDPNFQWPARQISTPDTPAALPSAFRQPIPSSNIIEQRPVAAINRDAPRDGRQLYNKNSATQAVSMDPAQRLIKLKRMFDKQLITPEDYQSKRSEILANIV